MVALPEIAGPPWVMDPEAFRRMRDDPRTREVAEERRSPSGSFTLAVTRPFGTQGPGWDATRGVVLDGGGKATLDLVRPYPAFPSAFIRRRGEPGGGAPEREYLVASAPSYTGTWVYDLRSGGAVVEGSRDGNAFCPISYHVSPDCRHMVAKGCQWGGPVEYLVFNLERVGDGFLSCVSVGDSMFAGERDEVEWRDGEVAIRAKWDDPGDEGEREGLKWAYEGMEYRVPLLGRMSFPHPAGCRCGGCEP